MLFGLTGAVLGLQCSPSEAQNNRFTQRSFVSSPVVRGMGDAGVALPGVERAFFYNPAHLPEVSSHFTVFGVQAAGTRSLRSQISFFNEQVQPAVQSDFDLSTSALSSLHRDAARLGRRPGRSVGALLLPSFVYSTDVFGLGGGIFAKTALNYRVEHPSAGVPSVWLLSRTDIMAVASIGLDLRVLGLSDLSLGVTGTQTRRFLAFKQKPLDRLESDETAVSLDGEVRQLDVGLSYEPSWWTPLPGTIRIGGALYDVLRGDYNYSSAGAGRMPFLNDVVGASADSNGGPSRAEIERARQYFHLQPSYRLGASYEISRVFFLKELGVALDYQAYQTGRQTPLARLHAGLRAEVIEDVYLRAGLSSGYPTGGVGIELGAAHFDYAIHGVEEGRRAGRLGVYVHTLRVLFRLE